MELYMKAGGRSNQLGGLGQSLLDNSSSLSNNSDGGLTEVLLGDNNHSNSNSNNNNSNIVLNMNMTVTQYPAGKSSSSTSALNSSSNGQDNNHNQNMIAFLQRDRDKYKERLTQVASLVESSLLRVFFSMEIVIIAIFIILWFRWKLNCCP